jgi:chromosome segregation ATPase
MKRGKLVILMIGMVISGMTSVYAQSKKEKIESLTRKIDSLEKALSVKNESLVQSQIKLAKLEGTTDTHNEEIKRLENKADSLKEALITKNMTVENQASKITQLNTDISSLQAQQKEWTSKNDALTAELNSLKQKPGDTGVTTVKDSVKDSKSTDPPKEEKKAGNIATSNKQDTAIKN